MGLLALYNDMVSILEALKNDNGEDLFGKVGYWNSQPLNEPIEEAFNYPACFIQFASIEWKQRAKAGGYHTGQAEEQESQGSRLTVHICHSHLEGVDISFPIIHAINQRVYYALSEIEQNQDYGNLIRIEERPDPNHDRIHDWQMDFQYTVIQTGQSVGKTEVEEGELSLIIPE